MNILAFDTTLNKTYIALLKGETIDAKVIESDDKNYHSAYLISAIKEIVQKNDLKLSALDLIAVNNGPGSFTGIRVGVTVAKTMAKELGVNVLGISSLDILQKAYFAGVCAAKIEASAQNAQKPDIVLDARKETFYFKNQNPAKDALKNSIQCADAPGIENPAIDTQYAKSAAAAADAQSDILLVPYCEIQNHITSNTVICDASSLSHLKESLKNSSAGQANIGQVGGGQMNIVNFEEDDVNLSLALLNIAKERFENAMRQGFSPSTACEGKTTSLYDFSWYTLKPRYIQPPPIHKK